MDRTTDILVAGAGAAGLSAAIGLARSGLTVAVAGEIDLRRTARTVALFDASLGFFESLGVLERLQAAGSPLEVMRIIDDTDSLFRSPPAEFRSSEIGLDAFGINIENYELVRILADVARTTPRIQLSEGRLTGFAFAEDCASAVLPDGSELKARLVVAADGKRSPTRAAAGIGATESPYPQTALTALLAHDRPHRRISTEFHTRNGPFTLVPLPASAAERHRSSLVWLTRPAEAERLAALDPASLARAIERQAHSMLGKFRIEGPVGLVPMTLVRTVRLTGRRLALVGDAAHSFPPIGAQGLNLGLRDVGHLVEAVAGSADPGSRAVLDRYAALREADVRMRSSGVDLLNRSLLTSWLPVDFLRGAGLMALSAIGPLRRAVMREGVSPHGRTPAMMQRRGQGASRLQ